MQVEQRKFKSPRGLWLAFGGTLLLVVLITGGLAVAWAVKETSFDVAGAIRSKSNTLQITTEILDYKGKPIGVISDETRFVVPYGEIPKRVRLAFVAAEDDGFFHHIGVSPSGIMRAAIANVRRDRFSQGGSTITQQLVRQLLLSREKSVSRKIREIILALVLERQMSKDEILGIWLNSVYLGNNAWGVEAAARHYFNKSIGEVTMAEASMLAGLPQAPSRFAPHVRPKAAKERQLYVLKRLLDLRWITRKDFSQASLAQIKIEPRRKEVVERAPWVTESVRLELWRRLEQKNLPKAGLAVTTTINRDWQVHLQSLVKDAFGSIREDGLEVAVIVLDTGTGDVRAQVGGSDFGRNQFNRALNLYRPIGAGIYPLVFAWGVERGLMKVDGYSSTAEAALKSGFNEAEQIAPELGYGLVRDKLMGLGFVVKDAMAIDEMHGSPLNLARAFLGVAGADELVPRGMINNVMAAGQSVYSSDEIKIKYPARMNSSVSWVIRKWMALVSRLKPTPLSGQPIMRAVKGWNSWWVVARHDSVICAWLGADYREPTSPRYFQLNEAKMDELLKVWIQKNLRTPDGIGLTPDGVSFMVYPVKTGQTTMRVPFVSSGEGVF